MYVLSVEETHIQNYFTKTIKIPFSRYPALGGGVGASSPPPRIASTVQEGRARVKEVSKRVLWPSPSQPDEAPPAPSAGQGEGEEETEEQSAKRRAESSGERKAALPSESEKKKKTKKTEEEETEETSLGGELLKASHKAVKSLHVLTGNAVTEPPPSAAASAPSLIQRNQNLEASDAAPASESASPSAAETEADAFFPVMTEATLKSIARVQGQEEEALSAESPSLSSEAAARSRENPAATGRPSLKASEKFATSQMRLRSLRAAADRLMGGAESAFANNSESTAFPAPEKNNQQPPTSVKTDDAPPSSSSRSELERKAPPTEGALPASEASEENNSPQPAEAGAAASQEGGPSSAGASHDEARELEATPKKREESEASASDKAISSTALNESQRGLSPLPQRIANPYYDKTLEAEKEFVGLKKGDVLLSLGAFGALSQEPFALYVFCTCRSLPQTKVRVCHCAVQTSRMTALSPSGRQQAVPVEKEKKSRSLKRACAVRAAPFATANDAQLTLSSRTCLDSQRFRTRVFGVRRHRIFQRPDHLRLCPS